MDKKAVIVAIAIIVVASAVPFWISSNRDNGDEDSDTSTSTFNSINFYVYFKDKNRYNLLPNSSEPLVGSGETFTDIIGSAFSKTDQYSVELDANGGISSVNDRPAEEGKAWVVFQWSPEWEAITPGKQANASLVENTSYLIAMVDYSKVSGRVVYTTPDVDGPVSKATFCLRFHRWETPTATYDIKPNQLGSGETGEKYREEIEPGLWISGYGSNAAEALRDACKRYFGWVETTDEVYGTYLAVPEARCGNLSSSQTIGLVGGGYLKVFLGLTDVKASIGYLYWNQYSWSDAMYQWDYNAYGLDGYDPAVTKFFGLIYTISEPMGSSQNPFEAVDPYDHIPE